MKPRSIYHAKAISGADKSPTEKRKAKHRQTSLIRKIFKILMKWNESYAEVERDGKTAPASGHAGHRPKRKRRTNEKKRKMLRSNTVLVC